MARRRKKREKIENKGPSKIEQTKRKRKKKSKSAVQCLLDTRQDKGRRKRATACGR